MHERARELQLSASKAAEMIKENMDIYDQQVQNFKTNIANQEAELAWTNRCMERISLELAELGIANLQFPSKSGGEPTAIKPTIKGQ